MRSRRLESHLSFDLPVALLELQYTAGALGLGDGELPAVEVPEHVTPPDGARERWAATLRAAIDDLDAGVTPLPAWLSPADAAPLDLTVARQWIRHERQKVIDSALMSTAENSPRVMRRARSLAGAAIRVVVVLPADGAHWARHPASSVLLVSLESFFDDDAWGDVVAGLADS